MPVLLVSSVGGSVEPIVASILNDNPAQVVFLCSADSRSIIESRPGADLQSALATSTNSQLLARRFEDVLLENPQDLEECVQTIHRRLTGVVRAWARRSKEHTVIVDFTGGTKCMSAALCFVAQRWPCKLRYVGGTKRTAAGIGVVVSGHEIVLESRNPWDALGYQAAEDAVLLCDRNSPASATELLDRAARQTSEPAVKRALQTLRAIASALHEWDLFDHPRALNTLEAARKNFNDLLYLYPEETCLILRSNLLTAARYLGAIASAIGSQRYSLLTLDLLANASRRIQEGRFDDAAARCYRAIEALAQVRLANHGIVSTKHVPFARLPDDMAARLTTHRNKDGTVMLALQQDYELLLYMGDPLGAKFIELGLTQKRSPLNVRNDSIMAHGDQPLAGPTAEKLFEIALELAGIKQQMLPQFPKLAVV